MIMLAQQQQSFVVQQFSGQGTVGGSDGHLYILESSLSITPVGHMARLLIQLLGLLRESRHLKEQTDGGKLVERHIL